MKIQLLQNHNNKTYLPFLTKTSDNALYTRFSNPLLYENKVEKDTFELSFEARARNSSYCTPDKFDVKRIKNLRCPVCQRLMLDDEQIQDFVDDVYTKTGDRLIYALEKYEDDYVFTRKKSSMNRSIYGPVEQEVVNTLKKLAKAYPNLNIRQLFQFQRVRSLSNIRPIQQSILDEYMAFALKHAKNGEQIEKIENIYQKYKMEIKNKGEERFKRKNLIYDTVHSFDDVNMQNEINEIVQKLPSSKDNADAFFVKYADIESPQEAARKLVERTKASAEHLVPTSKGGENRINNYIADCQACNMKRQNLDFQKWAKTIPNFKNNLQNYVDSVQIAIDNGIIDESWERYIPLVIQNIKELSKGSISLIIPETNNTATRVRIFAQRAKEVNDLEQEIQLLQQQQAQLAYEIELTESYRQYSEHQQYQMLCQDLADKENTLEECSAEIENLEERIENCEKRQQSRFHFKIKIMGGKRNTPENSTEKPAMVEFYEKQIRKIEHQMSLLKKDIVDLSRQINEMERKMTFLSDIEDKVYELRKKLRIYETQNSKIEKAKKEIEDEPELIAKCSRLESEIRRLEEDNKQIASKEGFDCTDTNDYDNYIYNRGLLEYSQNKQKQFRSMKQTKIVRMDADAYAITADEATRRINEYLNMDSVIYFINQNEMEKSRAELSECQKTLNEYEKKKNTIAKLKKRALEILGQDSYDGLQMRLKRLQKERRILISIRDLDLKKQEYDRLTEDLSKKMDVFSRIAEYKSLTSEEYRQIIQELG